jgi:hypothetical protein
MVVPQITPSNHPKVIIEMMVKTMENLWAFRAPQWAKFQKTSEKLPGAWSELTSGSQQCSGRQQLQGE